MTGAAMAVATQRPRAGTSATSDTATQHGAKTSAPPRGSAAMWPLRGDFTDAVQNPTTCFRDPFLLECDVERYGPANKPKPRGGAFATVFKFIHPDGRTVALRVFDGQALTSEKEERLIHISSHIRSLGAKRPDYLMEFDYQREGILVKGAYYPTLKMEFVDGVPLGNWYQARMAAKDLPAIKAMAANWQKLVVGLRSLQIAHGDLQHGNVMVRKHNNAPVLVDYDGMCVPGLMTNPPLTCLEFGLPGYVHPARSAEGLHLNLDHFPAWIILIALRASAADPMLYRKFVEETENENMLFSPSDISDPASSKLWPELLKCADPEVRAWAADLRASIDKPFSQIPPFQTDPLATLTELCNTTPPDWEAIQVEADRITQGGKPLPNSTHPNVMAKVATARKKVACRTVDRAEFGAAQTAGDPRQIKSFDAAVYADWPKHEGFVKQMSAAIAQGKLLTELETASKSSADGKALLAAWDKTKNDLTKWSLAQKYGNQAEAWRARIEAANMFTAIVGSPSTSESAIASSWARVVAAGQPHPSITPVLQERGKQAAARAAKLQTLKRIPAPPAPPTEKYDQELIALWDEPLLGKCPEASEYPARVAAAKLRLAALSKVIDAVKKAEAGSGPEAAIVAAAAALPGNYEYELRARVGRAREGEAQFAGIKNLLDQPKPSDLSLASEWEKFKSQFPKHVPLLEPARRARCELALKRRTFVLEFDRLVKSVKDAWQLDREIAELWQPAKKDMEGSAEMELEKRGARIKLALVRLKSWERLEQVLRAQDIGNIRAAFSPPQLTRFATYPPVAAVRPQIDELIRLADWLDDLKAKLDQAKRTTGLPITPTDLENLKRYGERLDAGMREAVLEVLRLRLWPAVRLAPSTSPPQLIPGPVPMAKVRWTWTGAELVSWFEVAAAPGPLLEPAAAARDRISRCRPADHAREGGGRLVVLGPGGSATISIWPVLDLGWTTLTGPPIHIGPIRSGR
jgi:hypothetical protein